MSAPNANPSNCGGVSVACCGSRVPDVLKASFSGVNTCGFNADAFLVWNGTKWTVSGVGCQGGLTIDLQCLTSNWTGSSLTISGSAVCVFINITLVSADCDGPEGFKLVFTATSGNPPPPMSCPCCGVGTTITITITNGLAASP